MSCTLARELYEEGDWRGARREALRVADAADDPDCIKTIAALSAVRLFPDDPQWAHEVVQAIEESQCADVAAWAGMELGRIRWAQNDVESAACLMREAFLRAEDRDLLLQSAYLLRVMALRYPHRVQIPDAIRTQVMTVFPLVTPAIQQAAAPSPRGRRSRLSARLAAGFVRFYQTQISPAIGQRCSMYPSCSVFCVQACQKYGAIGIAMTADRLIRETDHVNHRINPIWVDDVEKFYDPVEAHSFWFRRYR